MPYRPSTEPGKTKKLSLPEAKARIYRYCAYQERCHQEVKSKLYELGLRTSEVDELMVHLIEEGFLNEERFAKAYAGGKFRMNHWGKIKIVQGLEQRGISAYCIKAGLKEIEPADYRKTLLKILSEKAKQLNEKNRFVKRNKVAQHAIQKGFEPDLVWGVVKDLIPD
jgi:regulatory protein